MGKKVSLDFLVKGGEATPGPPIGPSLGPYGVPIGKVVGDINKATAKWKGMTVPVTVIIDTSERTWEIKVGVPPTSALIMKEANIKKGSGQTGKEIIGNLPLEKVVEIAKMKLDEMFARDLRSAIKQVLGTMVSMGVTCEEHDPREIINNLEEWLNKKNIKLK
ncbi:MAG: 50S ribosomal protein L11 [Candidatus Njordarchaeum guaymaensis]